MAAPRLLSALLAMAALVGCAPSGPDADSLVAEPDFAATMPGARVVSENAADPDSTVEGQTHGYVSRLWVTEATPDDVASWHAAALEGAGWHAGGFPYIAMTDGHLPEHAWRRGDFVIALGFPDRTNRTVEALELDLADDSTLYQTSITYQPED